MIRSFANKATEDIYHGIESRVARKLLPIGLWPIAQRKLSYLDAAKTLSDLREPPGNRLEKLKGDLAGRWSIRINDQYRIVFKFENDAEEVEIMDYH
jgi:toxin HigB-1